jgi:hypothetical protein
MSGIVMIVQIFGKYAREICHVLSWFYKYVVSMLERYVELCHDNTNM